MTNMQWETLFTRTPDIDLLLKYEKNTADNLSDETKKYTKNFEAIFDSTPNVLAIVNRDVRVEMINSKGVSLVGRDKVTLSGLRCGDVFNCQNSFHGDGCGTNPECPECPLRTRVLSSYETGEPHIEEEEQMTFWLNGRKTAMDILISTALLDIGGIKKVLLSLTDVSKSKDAIKTLRESEEKFRLAFHTSPDSINLNRLEDGVYLEINQGFTKIMGYTREETIGKTSLELNIWKNPDDRKRLVDGLQEKNYVENLEAEFVGKQGHIIDGLMSARILKINNEKVIISITRDITERNINEDKIKKSRKRYQTIMNAMEYPIYIGSQEFVIEYLNLNMIKRIGYDATGEKCFKAIHGFEKQCPWCIFGTIKKNKSQQINIVSPRDDRSFDMSLTPLVNDDGSVSTLATFRDITEIKKMTTQLQQAQKMEAIGTLAGGIAHDFNNILFPIVGYTEMLMADLPEDSHLRSSLDEIFTGSMRARDLVQQILTFSRQGIGELQPMKMQLIVKEALKLIRSSIPKSIEIKQIIQQECGLIKADPTQIHQILMNLTTNAYHAMEETGGTIDVKVQEVTLAGNEWAGDNIQPGQYALLSVSDTGCGIPKAHMDKIFDPYFTTKGENKGTGLGLSIIYGIVKKYNGEINVYSEVGKGTTFNIYLPLIKKMFQPVSANMPEIIQTGTERILLVDDEIPIIRLQKQMLERLGYKVTERSSSVEALRAFKANPDTFDLVITDMSMPNMNGDKLAKELTAIKPDIPIIICTGFSERIDKQIAKNIGIKGFLMKPVVRSQMAMTVRKVLDEIYSTKKTSRNSI